MLKYKHIVLAVLIFSVAVLLPLCLAESDEQYCKLGEPSSSVPCKKPCREYNAEEVSISQTILMEATVNVVLLLLWLLSL